jgi:hypothetical protein
MTRILAAPSAIAKLYIGDGPPETAVLTLISSPRIEYQDSNLHNEVESQYFAALGKWLPVGNENLTFALKFGSVDEQTIRLSRGLSLTASDRNVYGAQVLSMLILDKDPLSLRSVWIPEIQVDVKIDQPKQKGAVSSITIPFHGPSERDLRIPDHFQGTWSELAVLMDMRSPI